MKKMKILGLALLVACVGTVGFAGCTNASQPYDINIASAQKEFNIGDAFSLGEDFEVNLQFHTEKIMTLSNSNAKIDENKKLIRTVDYTIDYSHFDSSKGGDYPIFVTFNDHDLNKKNDIKKSYQVTVKLNNNSWVRTMSIESNGWHYGQFSQEYLIEPQAMNGTVKYSLKKVTEIVYESVNYEDLYSTLASLNEGTYSLKATCPQTDIFAKLESKVEFTVWPNLIPTEVVIPSNAGSKEYTGNVLSPDLPTLEQYCNIIKGSGNWTDIGTYQVTLTPKENWLWAEDGTKREKKLEFTVTPSTNEWISDAFAVKLVKDPYGNDVLGWHYGTTNPYSLFTARPEPKYGQVMYKYKLKDQNDTQYSGPQTLSDLLKLNPATYTIMAYVPASDNFTDLPSITIDVVVTTP